MQVKDNAKTLAPAGSFNNTTSPLTISGINTSLLPAFTTGYILTVWDETTYPDPTDDPNMEKVTVTAVTVGASGSLTVSRPGAIAHAGMPRIGLMVLAQHITDLNAAVVALESLRVLSNVSVSANTSAVAQTKYKVDATATAITVTLPATNLPGQRIVVQKSDTSVNLVNITGTIDGVTSATNSVRTQNQAKEYIGDGTGNWAVESGDVSVTALDNRYILASAGINGLISAGTNITITGAGTTVSPYVINAAAGGGGFTNPMTTLGDAIYGGASGAAARLAGNTTATRKFIRQLGDGTNSAAPAWDTLVAADIPSLSASYVDLTNAQTIAGAKTFSGAVSVPNLTVSGNITGSATSTVTALSYSAYGANSTITLTNTNDSTTYFGLLYATYTGIQLTYGNTSNPLTGNRLYIGRYGVTTNPTVIATSDVVNVTALSSLRNIMDDGSGNMQVAGNFMPKTTAVSNIGSSSLIFPSSWITKQNFNATASLDGATAGNISLTGTLTANATSIITDTTTGLKIGGGTTQRLGFFGVTPQAQQSAGLDLGTVLGALGFRGTGTAYAITTSGAVQLTSSIRTGQTVNTGAVTLSVGGASQASGAWTQLCNATSGPFAVTLPSTATSGYRFTIKKTDATANAITVTAGGSGTIDGNATYALSSSNKYVTIESTGTTDVWVIIGNN